MFSVVLCCSLSFYFWHLQVLLLGLTLQHLLASQRDHRVLPVPMLHSTPASLPSLCVTLPWSHCAVAAYHQGAASQQPQNLPPELD